MSSLTKGAIVWLLLFLAVLLWSATNPLDRFIWWLEVAPALLYLLVLAATRQRFPLTSLTYSLILVHSIILMVGGHYTYAEVPLFDSLAELFGSQRNDYDKLGHFAQGFVPAIIAREILIRVDVVRKRGWLDFLVVNICLAISAFYELIEWWVAVASGTAADAFLGTQGYEWDTQADMATALLGAILAVSLLGRLHDRQIGTLQRQIKH